MKRPTLAAALIVKNEEDNLKNVVNSLKDVVDKIYITDTGSTDRTVEIAKELGCEVSHFEWINDFAAARNFNFSQVKEDFILWIDGDDCLENKEEFINWRNDAMGVADYWLATYHYASDKDGNPNCSFTRERVVRNAKNFKWRYPVHEGISPDTGLQPVRMQFAQNWAIRHLRKESDIAKDRSRNLKIIESMPKRDSRMEYYYGKELFENNQIYDAAKVLEGVITRPDLEHHDRLLAFQYCSICLLNLNQPEKALSLSLQAIALDPNRAEFYCAIGDALLKIAMNAGDLSQGYKALPAYHAAMGCISAPINAPTAVFNHRDCASLYPMNQILRIKSNMGLLDDVLKVGTEFYEKHPNDETKAILDEVKKIKGKEVCFKDAKECDDIVISCPPSGPYEWDADLYKEKAMGGSETAAIEMGYWLHKLSGRKVKIFNNRTDYKVCDGVEYIPASKTVEYFTENKPYLNIQWRHNFKITDAPTFIWSHDLQTPGVEKTSNYDKVLCLTPFHQRYMTATQGVPKDKIFVTRNGIRPERFMDGPWKKDPNKVIFPSSPDRGLDRAMRIMDKVRMRHPDAYLAVYYGIEHLPKYGQTELMHKLKAMMDERPWVKYYGATQQDELIRHFKESAIWLYPSDWIETSCITAAEVLCSGVYPIARKVGGVVDTLAKAEQLGMASVLDTECVTESEYQLFVDEVCKVLETKAWERVKIDPETLSWKSVAEQWLKELPKLINGSSN